MGWLLLLASALVSIALPLPAASAATTPQHAQSHLAAAVASTLRRNFDASAQVHPGMTPLAKHLFESAVAANDAAPLQFVTPGDVQRCRRVAVLLHLHLHRHRTRNRNCALHRIASSRMSAVRLDVQVRVVAR
jgi:hypothetical protein